MTQDNKNLKPENLQSNSLSPESDPKADITQTLSSPLVPKSVEEIDKTSDFAAVPLKNPNEELKATASLSTPLITPKNASPEQTLVSAVSPHKEICPGTEALSIAESKSSLIMSRQSRSLSIKRTFGNKFKSLISIAGYHRPVFYWLIFLAALLGLFYHLSFIDNFESAAYDRMYKFKNDIPVSQNIIIAEINDDCKNLYGKMGAWPWSRKIHAQVISNLREFFKPLRIGVDILFLDPSNDSVSDFALARTIKKAGNVYLPYIFEFSEETGKSFSERIQGILEPWDKIKNSSVSLGFINFTEDKDGKLRRIPLLIPYQKEFKIHLAFKMLLDHLNVTLSDLKIEKGNSISFTDKNNTNYSIPIDNDYQMLLCWPGAWQKTFRHVSCLDIIQVTAAQKLEGIKSAIDPTQYKDSFILIGDTTTASVDMRPTPFDKRCPLVNVHAVLINQMLHHYFIRSISPVFGFSFSYLVGIMVVYFALTFSPLKTLISSTILFILIFSISLIFLIYCNLWLGPVKPLLIILITLVFITSYSHIRFKDHVDLKLSFEQKLSMADARLPQFRHNLKIGEYSNIQELGRGGMAVVYRGTSKKGKDFAIKVISPECLARDKLFKYRFKREIETMKKVDSPFVIHIYDHGNYQGVLYYVMELFPAGDLADNILRLSKITDWKWIIDFFTQLTEGLKAIHDVKLIHRDIKPANIMMNDQNVVKIADFGLAKPVEEGQILTSVGQVLGTPAYLAPELCTGESPGYAADIYAMGIVFYEIISAYRPFQEFSNMAALIQAKLKAPIPSIKLRRYDIPDPLAIIIDKMIAFNTSDRYSSCNDILRDLNSFKTSLKA